MPVRAIGDRLREATSTSHHEFWPAGISLLDPRLLDPTRAAGLYVVGVLAAVWPALRARRLSPALRK